MSKFTNEELIQLALKYNSFTKLLKNRKLYYKLHNRGILKEATKHMTRKKSRNLYSKPVVDLAKLIAPMYNYTSFTKFVLYCQSNYIVLRRHGLDAKWIFENKEDKNFIKNLIRKFGEEQLFEFIGE